MTTSGDDTARRLAAALRLAGMTQTELGELAKQEGLGRTDPEQIMQGKKAMQRIHAEVFARHLNLPVEWFTAADFTAWINRATEETDSRYAALLATLSEVRDDLEQIRSLQERVVDAAGGGGNG